MQAKLFPEFDVHDAHLPITGVKHVNEDDPMRNLYAELHGMDIKTFEAYQKVARHDVIHGLFEPIDTTAEEGKYARKLNVTVPMLRIALFYHEYFTQIIIIGAYFRIVRNGIQTALTSRNSGYCSHHPQKKECTRRISLSDWPE